MSVRQLYGEGGCQDGRDERRETRDERRETRDERRAIDILARGLGPGCGIHGRCVIPRRAAPRDLGMMCERIDPGLRRDDGAPTTSLVTRPRAKARGYYCHSSLVTRPRAKARGYYCHLSLVARPRAKARGYYCHSSLVSRHSSLVSRHLSLVSRHSVPS